MTAVFRMAAMGRSPDGAREARAKGISLKSGADAVAVWTRKRVAASLSVPKPF